MDSQLKQAFQDTPDVTYTGSIYCIPFHLNGKSLNDNNPAVAHYGPPLEGFWTNPPIVIGEASSYNMSQKSFNKRHIWTLRC